MSRALVAIAVTTIAIAPAAADRDPWAPGTPAASHARPGGRTRVHYVTTTADAVPPADADGSGVPDFVEEVAQRGDDVLVALAGRGFRAPIGDGALGGDDRLDVYLVDLAGADGSFVADTCTDRPFHCAGHVTIENDFAGYSYPSTSIAIRVLTSHELFHAVQAAYAPDQPAAWSEGSAVWAEELLYPEQDDFERLVAAFLAKPFRPLDRAGAGFGDAYPYGAALWPYFLELRAPGIVRAAWEASEDATFLDAIGAALAARGDELTAAWIDFTRANARTGRHADGTGYPDAARLAAAAREPALNVPGDTTAAIEGLSARYVPITGITGTIRLELHGVRPFAVEARATSGSIAIDRITGPQDGADLHHVLELHTDGRAEAELTITGVVRGSLPDPIAITAAPAPPPPPPTDDDGGCSAGGAAAPWLALAALARHARRRRRARDRDQSAGIGQTGGSHVPVRGVALPAPSAHHAGVPSGSGRT